MKNFISILIFVLSFSSCGNPSIKELGQGYFLTHNSGNDHSIAKPIEGHSTSETYSYIIYGDIVSFDFDSRFIIAAEKPRDSVPGIKNLPFEESERLFKKSNFRQYYILDKVTDKLNGPFTRTTFDIKRKELNVPSNLDVETNGL